VKSFLSVFAMGTIGRIVFLLMVVDRGQGIFKGSGFFGEDRGHKLPSLGDGESRSFFWKT